MHLSNMCWFSEHPKPQPEPIELGDTSPCSFLGLGHGYGYSPVWGGSDLWLAEGMGPTNSRSLYFHNSWWEPMKISWLPLHTVQHVKMNRFYFFVPEVFFLPQDIPYLSRVLKSMPYLRVHMVQQRLKILRDATKTQRSQINTDLKNNNSNNKLST